MKTPTNVLFYTFSCRLIAYCYEALQYGHVSSDLYTIVPDNQEQLEISCYTKTEGEGWMVFERRIDEFLPRLG